MAAFFSGKQKGNYSFLIEVGSGSVGMAIVDRRDPIDDRPVTVWSHREFISIVTDTTMEERLKRIVSLLMNEFLSAGATGFKALRAHDAHAAVSDVVVTIAAPWSHTTTQAIEYEQATPFAVTETLISSLGDTATTQVIEKANSSHVFASTQAVILNTTVQGALINDYLVTTFDGSTKTDLLSLIHTTSIAPKMLMEAVTEGIDKIVPHTTVQTQSFMLAFFTSLADHQAHVKEYALIDVTSEATEIGIVRNGALMSAISAPFGSYTLARELANLTNLTLEEAHSLLRLDETERAAQPAATQTTLKEVADSYASHLAQLFTETQDELLVPHSLYLMGDEELMPFLVTAVKAVGNASKLRSSIHPITPKFFAQPVATDPALSVLADLTHHR